MPDDQLVVITGAGSGIGRATARAFAARGARVVVADLDQARLAAVTAELGASVVLSRSLDVGDRAAMAAFADEVHRHGAADVIVNNAGVGHHGGMLATSLDDWDWVLRVNLMGVVHGCHHFVPAMRARGRGHVINVASVLGIYAPPTSPAYVASKFAVLGLTLSLRGELAGTGVHATAICPGMVATDIIHGSRFGPAASRLQQHVADRFQRHGADPAVVGRAIVDVIGKDVAVRPVTRDGWILYGLARFAPRAVGDVLGRALLKELERGNRPRS
jgi:NAD(P)-dependent dehydrogenase (short-subunit alcohol dehydrogenase family)